MSDKKKIRYIVAALGSAGDMFPTTRLAVALKESGHEVSFITQKYYEDLLASAGIPCVTFGEREHYIEALKNPDLWEPRKAFGALMANYRKILECVYEALEATVKSNESTVVISHVFTLPAVLMARERGLVSKAAAIYLAPSNIKSCYDPMRIGPVSIPKWMPMRMRRRIWAAIEKRWINPVAIAEINHVRSNLGLTPVNSFFDHINRGADFALTLFPAWFAPTQPDWPQPLLEGDFQLYTPYSQQELSGEMNEFLAKGEKPFLFTAGTGNIHGAKFFARASVALQTNGMRGIFITGDKEQIPEQLPENILWQSSVSLPKALKQAAGFVHHGGIGTIAEAMRAGVPQLVTPFAWDHFDNGARMAELNAGLIMRASHLTPPSLATALKTLQNSTEIKNRCAKIAQQMADKMDPAQFCQKIEGAALR